MLRGDGPLRLTHPGTRFVAPAGSGRHAHGFGSGRAAVAARVAGAAGLAEARGPVAAVRRAARTFTLARPAGLGRHAMAARRTCARAVCLRFPTPRRVHGPPLGSKRAGSRTWPARTRAR